MPTLCQIGRSFLFGSPFGNAVGVTERIEGGVGERIEGGLVPTRAGRRAGERARRTKIVATIGPASDAPATLTAMAEAGMDVARIPLAHGSIEDAVQRVRRVREAIPGIGIMADLPGPKIRAAPFPDGVVVLRARGP